MRENASDNMDLTQSTWMVRDLGQAASDVLLLEDDSVIAGGWDGAIKYWSAEGDTVWEIETPNRISCLTTQSNKLYATSGLHLLKIDLKTGTIDWQIQLEGSADAVVITKKCVIASSSVYDIEHNDFLESAIWSVSFEGDVLETHRMDERPWTLELSEMDVIAGLGRPKSGWIKLGENGNIIEQKEGWKTPTICSTKSNPILFGRADGSIVDMDETVLHEMKESITVLSNRKNSLLVADDSGRVDLLKSEAILWSKTGDSVVGLEHGFNHNGEETTWIVRWNGAIGSVSVRNSSTGDKIASMEGERVHALSVNEKRVSIATEGGQIMVWEQALFERRSKQEKPAEQVDEHRNSMLAKLRALRK
ncbi:MAG: hypothetical protein DWC00_02715 [Candidatus Poseidoniales archaeon]|nr:MAG: hypothetical protein DWC00_02715 [Candidatus Poseidoniales archaeon]